MSRVLVDTTVWSEFFRRTGKGSSVRQALADLVTDHRVIIIGPVRQELLSGLRSVQEYERLRDALRAFPDLDLVTEDHELAASFFYTCRGAGIQGSFIGFLICAVSARHELQIFTLDKDFVRYSKHLPIRLFQPKAR